MAEDQGAHRRSLEKKVINGDNVRSILGIVCGFIIGMGTIGGAIYLLSLGINAGGLLLGLGGLTSLVGVFIYGSQLRKKERLNKYGTRRER